MFEVWLQRLANSSVQSETLAGLDFIHGRPAPNHPNLGKYGSPMECLGCSKIRLALQFVTSERISIPDLVELAVPGL